MKNIINTGEKIYALLPVEENKKYTVTFELAGKLQFKIGIQKKDSHVKQVITRFLSGLTGKYFYSFTAKYSGELYIEIGETDYNNWTAINNIMVKEV